MMSTNPVSVPTSPPPVPLPAITDENRAFFEGCKKHEFLIQKCSSCGTWIWLPRTMCPYCNSFDLAYQKASGKGKVFSWTVIHPPTLPAFQSKIPFPVVLLELEEGVHMVSRVLDCKAEELQFGMPVELAGFEDVGEDVAFPMFKRAR